LPAVFGFVDGALEVDYADLDLGVDGGRGSSQNHGSQSENNDSAKAH
jgi:hypothetical protein